MKTVLEADNIMNRVLDFFDVSKKVSKYKTANLTKDSTYLGGSISNYVKDLVLTFPVLCDNSLPPSTASMINRANERSIVSMLQILFSSMQFNAKEGREVIQKIHKNISTNYSLDDAIDAVDKFIADELREGTITQAEVNQAIRIMMEQLKVPQKSFPVESLSEKSLNNYTVYNMNGRTVVREAAPSDAVIDNLDSDDLKDLNARLNAKKAARAIDKEDLEAQYREAELQRKKELDELNKQKAQNQIAKDKIEAQYREAELQRKKELDELNKQKAQNQIDEYEFQKQYRDIDRKTKEDFDNLNRQKLQNQLEKDKIEAQYREAELQRKKELDELNKQKAQNQIAKDKIDNIRNAQRDKNEENRDRFEAISRQLLDSDVKKANELQPTLMIIRFNELDPNGVIYSQKPFVAGVKSRLISVDSEDIIDRISVKNKTKVNFLNFIRATTGEISFVKDFILCLNQNKIDAKNAVKKGEAAKMWKVLENRSSKNFLNKNKRTGNDASAITTLVINQETVNILKKESDFDLEKIKNARNILDAYNLLGIIICDESIEVAKVLYAGNDNWEQQAYSYLEKESNDNSYKKVINLIGKMNGR